MIYLGFLSVLFLASGVGVRMVAQGDLFGCVDCWGENVAHFGYFLLSLSNERCD